MIDDIMDKIVQQKIIKGPWSEQKPTHEKAHQNWFDNLIGLLADLEHADTELPRDDNGTIRWDQISIAFLIQWSMLNTRKITHKHGNESATDPI